MLYTVTCLQMAPCEWKTPRIEGISPKWICWCVWPVWPALFIALCADLIAELQLDWLKGTRGGVRRVLFLDTQLPHGTGLLTLGHNRPRACLSHTIYLKVSKKSTNKNPVLFLCIPSSPNVQFTWTLSATGGWWVQGQADTHLAGPELQFGPTLEWPWPPTCPQPLQQHRPSRACECILPLLHLIAFKGPLS